MIPTEGFMAENDLSDDDFYVWTKDGLHLVHGDKDLARGVHRVTLTVGGAQARHVNSDLKHSGMKKTESHHVRGSSGIVMTFEKK
jgi:hypothetical protein